MSSSKSDGSLPVLPALLVVRDLVDIRLALLCRELSADSSARDCLDQKTLIKTADGFGLPLKSGRPAEVYPTIWQQKLIAIIVLHDGTNVLPVGFNLLPSLSTYSRVLTARSFTLCALRFYPLVCVCEQNHRAFRCPPDCDDGCANRLSSMRAASAKPSMPAFIRAVRLSRS